MCQTVLILEAVNCRVGLEQPKPIEGTWLNPVITRPLQTTERSLKVWRATKLSCYEGGNIRTNQNFIIYEQ